MTKLTVGLKLDEAGSLPKSLKIFLKNEIGIAKHKSVYVVKYATINNIRNIVFKS